jgi:hypothetical protein
MGLLHEWFGHDQEALEAEQKGDLPKAAQLWMAAGKRDQAARVLVLQAESSLDPQTSFGLFTRAASLCPDSPWGMRAREKRARFLLALSQSGSRNPMSAVSRLSLTDAAQELERLDDPQGAAELYTALGDLPSLSRVLANAGDIDQLERVLGQDLEETRVSRRIHDAHRDFQVRVASGARRLALEQAETLARELGDQPLADRAKHLRAARALGPRVAIACPHARLDVVLGSEIVLGREGALPVHSAAVSRHHLRVFRQDGHVVVEDLKSRNGTFLRGLALSAFTPVGVGDGLELRLGREVPVRITPESAFACAIEVAGTRWLAPLGDTLLVGGFVLRLASDSWVELCGAPAILGGLILASPTPLLIGDAIQSEPHGEPRLRVLG